MCGFCDGDFWHRPNWRCYGTTSHDGHTQRIGFLRSQGTGSGTNSRRGCLKRAVGVLLQRWVTGPHDPQRSRNMCRSLSGGNLTWSKALYSLTEGHYD